MRKPGKHCQSIDDAIKSKPMKTNIQVNLEQLQRGNDTRK